MSDLRAFDDVEVGEQLPELTRLVTREDVLEYAEASGDRNPLHQDDEFARAVGFEQIIAHGMFTMGTLATCVTKWAGDAGALVRMKSAFRSTVAIGDTIVAGGRVRSLDPDERTATLEVWVRVDRDGAVEEPIRRSEAVVRLRGV